jgi:hypothetical protein
MGHGRRGRRRNERYVTHDVTSESFVAVFNLCLHSAFIMFLKHIAFLHATFLFAIMFDANKSEIDVAAPCRNCPPSVLVTALICGPLMAVPFYGAASIVFLLIDNEGKGFSDFYKMHERQTTSLAL